jgi:hypothetical protein
VLKAACDFWDIEDVQSFAFFDENGEKLMVGERNVLKIVE